MLTTHEQHSRAKLLATVLSVLVIAGVVVFANHIKSKPTATQTLVTTTTKSSSSATSANSNSTSSATNSDNSSSATDTYADGTYTATSDYFVPSGQQSIEVKLTLSGDTITAASIQNSESDPTSSMFQQDFASQYKSYVIGQKISSLQLSVIAGASDTTQGFTNAVSQIETKAKA
jgi:uncharacterized protein with FMN-binding domain